MMTPVCEIREALKALLWEAEGAAEMLDAEFGGGLTIEQLVGEEPRSSLVHAIIRARAALNPIGTSPETGKCTDRAHD